MTGVIIPFGFSKAYEADYTRKLIRKILDSEPILELNESRSDSEDYMHDSSDSYEGHAEDLKLGERRRSAKIITSSSKYKVPPPSSAIDSKYLQSSLNLEKSEGNKKEYNLPFYTSLSDGKLKDLKISQNYSYMLIKELVFKREYYTYTCPVKSLAVFTHILPLESYDCLGFMNDMQTWKQVQECKNLPPIVKSHQGDEGLNYFEFDHSKPQRTTLSKEVNVVPRLVAWIKIKYFDNMATYEIKLTQPVLCRFITLKLIEAPRSYSLHSSNMDLDKFYCKGLIVKSDFYREKAECTLNS